MARLVKSNDHKTSIASLVGVEVALRSSCSRVTIAGRVSSNKAEKG